MHIIFGLEEADYMTPKELDQFICAELPDQYHSEKVSTVKPIMDGKGEPIYKQDENDENNNNQTITQSLQQHDHNNKTAMTIINNNNQIAMMPKISQEEQNSVEKEDYACLKRKRELFSIITN